MPGVVPNCTTSHEVSAVRRRTRFRGGRARACSPSPRPSGPARIPIPHAAHPREYAAPARRQGAPAAQDRRASCPLRHFFHQPRSPGVPGSCILHPSENLATRALWNPYWDHLSANLLAVMTTLRGLEWNGVSAWHPVSLRSNARPCLQSRVRRRDRRADRVGGARCFSRSARLWCLLAWQAWGVVRLRAHNSTRR